MKKIQACLLEEKPDIRIFVPDRRTPPRDENTSSQEQGPDTMTETNDIMTKSARVITGRTLMVDFFCPYLCEQSLGRVGVFYDTFPNNSTGTHQSVSYTEIKFYSLERQLPTRRYIVLSKIFR